MERMPTHMISSIDTYRQVQYVKAPYKILCPSTSYIIANERSGMEVCVRVILRAVGNFVDKYLDIEHYGMATYGQI